jgi:hypothetical protein
VITEIAAFVRGDVTETTSVIQKAKNDLGIAPERMIRTYAPLHPDAFRTVALEGIKRRREPPRVWMAPAAPRHYRLMVGAFDFKDAFWGAVLMDPDGNIIHRWPMNGEIAGLTDKRDVMKNLYGIAIFPEDLSAIFNMQEGGGGLVKVDACGEVIWTKAGKFHHTVSPTEDRSAIWTFGGYQGQLHPLLLKIDVATGETLRTIDMAEVAQANAGTYIFDLRRTESDNGTHPNDIEPLPSAWASAFPGFAAGDLLISYHNTNLLFVLDPETLEIKWWYVGAADGQHDPDWLPNGLISVFNNEWRAPRRDWMLGSTIVLVNPATNKQGTWIGGERYHFWSATNGRQQLTDNRTVIITSSTQGRIFEVDLATKEVVFEFVNAYDWEGGTTLHLSDAFIIDEAMAERLASQDCASKPARGGI